jgi:hypothetical protein
MKKTGAARAITAAGSSARRREMPVRTTVKYMIAAEASPSRWWTSTTNSSVGESSFIARSASGKPAGRSSLRKKSPLCETPM